MSTNRTLRMARLLVGLVAAAAVGLVASPDATALEIGKPAPDFALASETGETISLKQFRGKKIVLLEFFGAAFAPT
jgi:thioredoxin-dependent peroxiredoxin